MTCYYPIKAWRSREGRQENGKWRLSFKKIDGYSDLELQVPCGRCMGCRLARSRVWATRIMHEAQLHDKNCFLTLTYNDENLPSDNNLHPEHLQKFWKRLRKHVGKFRYFACGEYGEKFGRPHYHAILFGLDFDESRVLFNSRNGFNTYRSQVVEDKKLWYHGIVGIGDCTFESAAYTARYIIKKQLGLPDGLKDCVIDYKTGELLFERTPEFVTMSRRPGIGRKWYDHYKRDMYPHDFVVIRGGAKVRPARYYDNIFDLEFPKEFRKIKAKRKWKAEGLNDDLLPNKALIQAKKYESLKRRLDIDT